MLRRLIVVGLAAGLAAPILAVTPTTAAVLFSCPANSFSGNATITPGLGHTQTAQTVSGSGSVTGCSNGQSGTITFGSPNVMNSYPPKPLGCPVALGGAGPEYADQTPILLGADPSFTITWSSGPASTGVAKAKSAGPAAPGLVRVVLAIKSGQYFPAKVKSAGVQFVPTDTYTCADDSDRISAVSLSNSEQLIVKT